MENQKADTKAAWTWYEADISESQKGDGFVQACRMWFKEISMEKGWNSDRVMLTCDITALTLDQLGALCGLCPAEMRLFMRRDRFPIPICLLFRMIEQWHREVLYGSLRARAEKPPMPIHFLGRIKYLQAALAEVRKREQNYVRTRHSDNRVTVAKRFFNYKQHYRKQKKIASAMHPDSVKQSEVCPSTTTS